MVSGLQIALDCETVQGLWWPVCCRAEQFKVGIWACSAWSLWTASQELRIIFLFYSTSLSFQNTVWPWNTGGFKLAESQVHLIEMLAGTLSVCRRCDSKLVFDDLKQSDCAETPTNKIKLQYC